MADEAARSRLGRGLAALIGDVGEESKVTERGKAQRKLPVEFLRPNPRNPRRTFSEAELAELAASVQERGIIQPILVRAVRGANDSYEIIAGERRWRAAQRAGLHEVPVVVIEATDEQSLEYAIIENVQRADLNAIEEALGYEALVNEFSHSQEAVAQIVGKSRSHVANTLRLLKLSEKIKTYIRDGKLSAGHARMLIGQANAEQMAEDIVTRGLNVRQTEALARDEAKKPAKTRKTSAAPGKDADTLALEKRLTDVLGLAVTIDHRDGAGVVHVRYRDYDQLDEIIRRLERNS